MEAGFLLGNKASKKSGLAAKVKNIEGKTLGKDGKPLKSCLKGAGLDAKQVKPVGASYIQTDRGNTTMSKVDLTNASCASDKVTSIPNAHVADTVPVVDVIVQKLGSDEVVTNKLKQDKAKQVQVLVLNDEKVLGANVVIPMAVVDEMCDKFANTLYGYFIGKRLAFPIVEA